MEQPNMECRTLIVGLGTTGLSCARFLARQGIEVAITDSRVQPPALAQLRSELPDVPLFVGGFNAAAFDRAERIVLSPGVSLEEPFLARAQARGVEVIGDIELFARAANAPVVAITGTNGKSTVTTLVGEMAIAAGKEVRVGGNLGTPALDLLAHPAPASYVLELSSFQLETTHSLAGHIAALLNLSPDHLDRYRDQAAYGMAKQRIFRHAALQVVNRDDAAVLALLDPGLPVRGFTLGVPAAGDYGLRQVEGVEWLAAGETLLLPARELRLAGRHNLANALAALAIGAGMGLATDAMLASLRQFAGLPHRTQWLREREGVNWYNDSKGTNVGATQAAIAGMSGPVVLIAGGEGKGQDFSPLARVMAGAGRGAVLIGRDAPLIEAVLRGLVPVVRAGSMEQAVARAAEMAVPGDCVLLSPACASFDMFENYAQRGRVFAAAVERLP
jgi:UDP-N-acetylmuramoylalanine--D-glutamate ligase